MPRRDIAPPEHPGRLLVAWLRTHDGWTQRKLAAAVGISAKHMSMIATGRSLYSVAMAERFSAVTGISIRELLTAKNRYELSTARKEASSE